MANSSLSSDLDRCLRLADIADGITMDIYHAVDLGVKTKPDKTPVTEGDLAVDSAFHDIITSEFGDAYLSEESSQTHTKGRQWIVDPIDGTKNFIRRHPFWATLIAVRDESGTLAAAVSAPALGRRWWAARGQGAWTRDVDGLVRRIHVSQVSQLSDAYITYCSLLPWGKTDAGVAGVINIMKASWRERSPGDSFGYLWTAEGAVDACFEPNAREWDIAAPAFIVEEAGGSVLTAAFSETPATNQRPIIVTNGHLEHEIRTMLKL